MDAPAGSYEAELRAWIARHLTDRHRGLSFTGEPDAEWLARMREWNHMLADARHAAPGWPVEWGGRGAGVLEQVAHARVMAEADAPGPLNAVGIPNIAPAIMAHGTPDQQRRHLPALLRGDDVWCQGFSEPDAGSDLASLRTRAERDGDHYVVHGHKVWTTFGAFADRCELLVRTGAAASRPQAGITCLLLDMRSPGVEVRPLRSMTGSREFSELVLAGVRVPVGDRLGGEDEGWRVAMGTLANERVGVATLHLRLRSRIDALVAEAHESGSACGPLARTALAGLWSEARLLGWLSERALARADAGLPPGPESSVIKLAWSRLAQRLPEVAVRVLGADALEGAWGRDLVHSRSLSIAGGTTEVNSDVVAERVLGLPRG